MPKTRIPSPARSQGGPATPRRHPRGSRSVGSPARSNTSSKLTAVIQNYKEKNIDEFVLSPLPSRRSMLTDTTDIGEPRRKSWWKKLDENSRDIMAVLEDNVAMVNNVVEELDVEFVSQEQKNYVLDLPESSDSESISSIVIPQRKLFTDKHMLPQQYGQLIGCRDSTTKLHKTYTENEKTINPGPKILFGQSTKFRTKPIFPAELLNISPDKTINKTKETAEVHRPIRSLFGNRPAVKRKHMFTDFIVSESEDEIPEIQPRVFGFHKKAKQDEEKMSTVCISSAAHGLRGPSPTNSMTRLLDISGDWNLLPSSTMVQETDVDDDNSRDNLGLLAYSDDEPADNTIEKNVTIQNNSYVPQDINASKACELEENQLNDESNNIEKEDITIRNISKNEISLVKNYSNNTLKQKHALTKENENFIKASDNGSNESAGKDQDLEPENVQHDNQNIHKEHEELLNERRLSARNRTNNGDISKKKNLLIKETDEAKNVSNKTQNISPEKYQEEKRRNTKNESKSVQKEPKDATVKSNDKQIVGLQDENEKELQNDCQAVQMSSEKVEAQNPQTINENEKLSQNHQIDIQTSQNISQMVRNQNQEVLYNKPNSSLKLNNGKQQTDYQYKIVNESNETRDENQKIQNEEQDDKEHPTDDEDPNEVNGEDSENEQNVSQKSQKVQKQKTDNKELINESDEICNKNPEVENENREEEDNEESPKLDIDMEESVDKNLDIQNVSQESQEQLDIQEQKTDGQDFINESDGICDVNQQILHQEQDGEVDQEGLELDENTEETEDENKDIQNVSQESQDEQDIQEQETDDETMANESNEIHDENQEVESEDQEEDDEEDSELNEDTEEPEVENLETQNASQEIQEQETDDQVDEIDEDDSQLIENESQENVSDIEEAQAEENEKVDNNEADEKNQTDQDSSDHTIDTTGRNRKKDKSIVKSPEAILHDRSNQINSFAAQGRNTSIRKTKSMTKDLNIQPSLAPVRESTGFSDGTKNSSAEGSCWDSHRVTKKTLRLTFGKDFTPRKSLRALVMEKSAKRHTEFNDVNMDTIDMPRANSTEYPDASNRYDDIENEKNGHEISKKMSQTTLEMYLQKNKKENMEKRKKMEEAIRNNFKMPPSDPTHLFRMPARPNILKQAKKKIAQDKPNAKKTKSVIPLELPEELLEDMKYKPPQRFKPRNAGWVTKRLYKYFETKLEPKYDYKARVRAEKLVETIYNFTKDIRRHHVAPASSVEVLKHEMARLGIVKTHHEFYCFIHEFMPREVRVKVIPDIVNKIPLPRLGPFSDILRDVQG